MKQKPTESVILDAAMRVFTRKGFAATRTEEIAKEAGMNRALLHYYYRDKQTIFNLIFEKRFSEFFKGLFIIFETDSPLFEKIEKMVGHEISTISQHPDLPRFILMEVAQHPERLIEYGQKLGLNPRIFLEQFERQVQAEVLAGKIRPIEGRQLIINIMSLCMYPFVAKPIIKTMMQLDESKYFEMQERRKKEVYEFIIHAIKVPV